MVGWTSLCWMVKLTGSVRLVLFTVGKITVKTSEFIAVLFSVLKYWWLRRLSIPFSVRMATAAEPVQMIKKKKTSINVTDSVITVIIFCVMDFLPPLLASARACKFISNVCPLAERATLLSSWLSGPMVRRLKSWMKITLSIVDT